MASSSSSRSRETMTNTHINGEFIKFRNEWCKCNKKAVVRISESASNPSKLYFKCENEGCNFFKFWEPKNSDVNWSAIGGNTSTQTGNHEIIMQVRSLESGLHIGIQGLQMGLQGLTSAIGGIKLMMMLCFFTSLVSLFALFIVAMK